MNNNTKKQIRELERQIDVLLGYRPSGQPWRTEYLIRKTLIRDATGELRDKLRAIQINLDELYKELPYQQGYIRYRQKEVLESLIPHEPIRIKTWVDGKQVYEILEKGE